MLRNQQALGWISKRSPDKPSEIPIFDSPMPLSRIALRFIQATIDRMSISATSVRFDEHMMWIDLTDGRHLVVPLAWFPRLLNATPAQRRQVEISRVGLHWEAIDEDISITGLLTGQGDKHATKLTGWIGRNL